MGMTGQKDGDVMTPAASVIGVQRPSLRGVAAFAVKLTITIGCLWWAFRSVALSDLVAIARTTNVPLALGSVLIVLIQLPLVALRWCKIVDALAEGGRRVPRGPMIAVTAIGVFFGQVTPTLVGDGIRMWLLARLGKSWRDSVVSVLIDRAIGVGTIVAVAFIVLLFPSRFLPDRSGTLIVLGAMLALAVLATVLAPVYVPMLLRWPATRWLGVVVQATSRMLLHRTFGPQIIGLAAMIAALSVISLWLLAAAQDLDLSMLDAAVLMTVMAGVTFIPFAVAGWGVREVAITALLQANGVAPERALILSISFGLVILAASSAGAVVWAFFSPERVASRT